MRIEHLFDYDVAMRISDALGTTRAGLLDLHAVAWDEVDPEDLPDVAVELERLRSQLDAARLRVADLLEQTGAVGERGWASTKDFLTAAAGGRKGTGGGMLRLAERLRDLPSVQAALADGWLSEQKARVVAARVALLPRVPELRDAAERALLRRAVDLDATDLDRSWRDVVKELDPDGALLGQQSDLPRAERAAHHARYLGFTPDELGGVWCKGYGSVEDVELVKAVLMPLAAPVTTAPGACGGVPGDLTTGRRATPCPESGGCCHDGRDLRDFGARLWDALVEACRRLQGVDVLPQSHGAGPRVAVTVQLEPLLDGLAEVAGTFPGGQPMSAQAARRLACDAELIPVVLGARSEVLDVGRAQRLVTPAIWRALVVRDQHCAFPGCQRLPEACDAHHVVHWADGGPTSLDNLALLCRRHHTIVHQTAWRLEIDPVARRPVWHPPPRRGAVPPTITIDGVLRAA